MRRFRTGDPLGGLPLGRALLVAAVVAVVLPLLVVTTALTGFTAVERAHANAIGLLTAQQYQQDANLMYATIHGDVLESLEGFEGNNESGAELAARTRAHVARLNEDLRKLNAATLATSLARGRPCPGDGAEGLRRRGGQADRSRRRVAQPGS